MTELAVFTRTKKLFSYILKITETSPIKYRYSFVNKMHNTMMEIIELLYMANYITIPGPEAFRRYEYQRCALVKFSILDFVCESANEADCITMKQYNIIAQELKICRGLLTGWIESDKKRTGRS